MVCISAGDPMKLTAIQVETIKAMAENSLNYSAVGRATYRTPATVYKCCLRIKEKTGLDPNDFYDLVKLLKIVDESERKEAVKVRGLAEMVDNLLAMDDEELADQVIMTNDVRWCLEELSDLVKGGTK